LGLAQARVANTVGITALSSGPAPQICRMFSGLGVRARAPGRSASLSVARSPACPPPPARTAGAHGG
jgi:hypothetical protein